jgi:ABC-type transport system involved in multi-copper enzyme maturation permease subunit
MAVRELSGVARRWQSYASRMFYVALIGVIVSVYWYTISERAAWMSPSEYAVLGRTLFYFFAGLQVLFVTLAGVSAASDLVSREVKGGTLGLLALTPLTPWRIAAGKWKAALAQAGTLVLCGVPVLAICVFLGGVGPWQLAWCTSLSIAAGALGAALSLLFSTLVRSGAVAVMLSLGALFLYNLLPGIVLAAGAGPNSEQDFVLISCVHVHYAFAGSIAGMEARGFMNTELLAYAWIPASLSTLGLSGVLLFLASIRIGDLLRFPATPPPPETELSEGGPSRPVWQRHAILWKELRTTALGRIRRTILIALGLVFAGLLPISALMMQNGGWGGPFYWLGAVVLLFLAMSRGAGLFVQEREERKWEVLLSTPLTPREILLSKLLAGLVPLLPFTLLYLLLVSACAGFRGLGPLGWAMSTGSVLLTVLAAYAVGGWASLRSSDLRRSFSITFGLVLGALLGFPAILALLGGLFDWSRSDDRFPLALIKVANPVYFMAPVTELVGRDSYSDWGAREANSDYSELIPEFLVFSAIAGAVVAGTFYLMRAGFRRVTGRA